MDAWVRNNIINNPILGPAWQRYPLTSNSRQWPFRLKAGDFPTVLYMLNEGYRNQVFRPDRGNWKKATDLRILQNRREDILDNFVKPRLQRLQ